MLRIKRHGLDITPQIIVVKFYFATHIISIVFKLAMTLFEHIIFAQKMDASINLRIIGKKVEINV